MMTKTILLTGTMFVTALLSHTAAADCGEVPNAPELIDGSTATMEQLVSLSGEVKTFITDADTYLDCREAAMKTSEFTDLSEEAQAAWKEQSLALIRARNEIGDNFNNEVQAYKAANP